LGITSDGGWRVLECAFQFGASGLHGNQRGKCERRTKTSPLSNGAKNYFSERENGPKGPVDLPLRLDDAAASPTTPQGPTSARN
jgi:hypothetical protein